MVFLWKCCEKCENHFELFSLRNHLWSKIYWQCFFEFNSKASQRIMVISICQSSKNSYLHKAPLYHVLFSEHRLLHYMFARIFYPKNHSKGVSNEIALEAVYRLMNGYSVDHASAILHHMYRIANLKRNPSLPYGNLVTWIFNSVQSSIGPWGVLHSTRSNHFI